MASSTCFSTFFVTEEQPVNANGRTSKPIAILLFICFSPLHGSFCMSVYVGFCKYYTTFHQKTQVFYRDFCEFVILFSPFSQYTPKPPPSESSKPSRLASAVTISAIGHIRLCKLQSHHLQSLYQNLHESGIKQEGTKNASSEQTIKLSANMFAVLEEYRAHRLWMRDAMQDRWEDLIEITLADGTKNGCRTTGCSFRMTPRR